MCCNLAPIDLPPGLAGRRESSRSSAEYLAVEEVQVASKRTDSVSILRTVAVLTCTRLGLVGISPYLISSLVFD